MSPFRFILLLVVFVLFLGGCASLGQPRPEPPTLDQIVEMSKAGTPPKQIIQRINESGAIYRLSASELVKLHDQGVSDEVLDYIHNDYLEDVRRDEAYRSYHYYGWYYHPWRPYHFYPYPYYWRY